MKRQIYLGMMSKQMYLAMVAVLLIMLLTVAGCGGAAKTSATAAGQGGSENEVAQQDSDIPHSYTTFKGKGAGFAGGVQTEGYDLVNIRRVPHPEFTRLVFEFHNDLGEPGDFPPEYSIELKDNPFRVEMIIQGTIQATVLEKKEQVLSQSDLLEDLTFEGQEEKNLSVLELFLTGPATYQVFDLGNPSRIVVVLDPADVT